MSSIRKRNIPLDPLQKRIPVNSRYKDVKPTIDTGASITKYLQRIEDIKQNYKFSKDEIFKRMKISTFVQLLVQVFKLTHMNNGEEDFNEDDLKSERGMTEDALSSNRSTFVKLSQGEGEMDNNNNFNNTNFYTHNPRSSTFINNSIKSYKNNNYNNNNNNNNTNNNNNNTHNNKHLLIQGDEFYSNDSFSPYLLLDIRTRDEYDLCHITTALSYAKAILSRSVNYESKEMLAFKNKEGKIIVVYDEDEKDAIVVASTLVQRGYDNVFMLSGGLKVALKTFPEGLVTGQPPSHLAPKHRNKPQHKLNHIDNMLLNKQNEDFQKEGKMKNNRTLSNKDLHNYINNTNNDTETTNPTHLYKHSHSTNSLNSNNTNSNNNNKLQQEDVDKLQIYLHNQPTNTETSSRMSSRLSTTSKTTTASSSTGRPPFKP